MPDRISCNDPLAKFMGYAEDQINITWPHAERIGFLRRMMRIRRFEQACLKTYQAGELGGWLLLDIGQETIAVGVRSLLGPEDHTISGPRGLGHTLAAGLGMGPCLAELQGKRNGCSKGKGGMFSMFSPSNHHWGCHGIAAAQTPLAAGLAFGLKQRAIPGAVVCFLGDGATNQGVYHESLNLAGLFGLPVVFIIENNGYSMGTTVARSSSFTECLARRAESYGIAWDKFSDANPYEIRCRVYHALEAARREHRPTVLEIDTYRYYGFSISDANHKRYRTVEEIEERKSRDPLEKWRNHLLENQWLTIDEVEAMDEGIKQEIREAIRFARDGTPPGFDDICRDVYWESDHETPASRNGWHFFNDSASSDGRP